MNESLHDMNDDDLLAIERELTKLKPAAHSPSLESRLEQALGLPRSRSTASAVPLRWQGWNLACLGAAACLAIIAAWHVSQPVVVTPGKPDVNGAVAGVSEPPPQSLLAMQQAMARSDTAALKAVDAAAASSPTSARTSSPLRACNTQDLFAVLDGL